MLFNTLWDKSKTVTADPFKLDTLIAWLETRDPKAWYEYRSCTDCVLAQYFAAHDMKNVTISKNLVMAVNKLGDGYNAEATPLPSLFNWIAEQGPHDFGSALQRAELVRDDPYKAAKANFEMKFGGEWI